MWEIQVKKLIIAGLVLILAEAGNATTIAPLRPICADDEIIWFDVSDGFLVTCRANGIISLWEIGTREPISHFMIDNSQLSCLNPSLFVSRDGRPVLADIQAEYIPPDNSECYFVVSFYDLATGGKTKTARVDDITELTGLGFSNNAKEFFCVGDHYDFGSGNEITSWNEVVLCISVETGKIVWRSEYDAQLGPPTTQVVPGRDSYVTFDTDLITARDNHGKILWEKTITGRPIHIHPFVGPVKTFYAVPTKRKKIFAISLLDGKKLWEKSGVSADSLLAVTHDGKRQAFYIDRFLSDDLLLVTSLPNKENKTFKGIPKECNAVFTKDGKTLLCLPRLKKVAEDRKAHTRTFARGTNLMKVVDCETGEVIGLDLRRP
jgi:outer membrane protein assembly factor BamB